MMGNNASSDPTAKLYVELEVFTIGPFLMNFPNPVAFLKLDNNEVQE